MGKKDWNDYAEEIAFPLSIVSLITSTIALIAAILNL